MTTIIERARAARRVSVENAEYNVASLFIEALKSAGVSADREELVFYPLMGPNGSGRPTPGGPSVYAVPLGHLPSYDGIKIERVPLILVDRFVIGPRFYPSGICCSLLLMKYAPCVNGFFGGESPSIVSLIDLGQAMEARAGRFTLCNHMNNFGWTGGNHPWQIDELPKP